ncbi:MAG: hypothetical protein MJ057_03790 [Sphaerochaetaceae bacterium]|nr:hypothetical protein [Sphaerochaetaceae bacterium]
MGTAISFVLFFATLLFTLIRGISVVWAIGVALLAFSVSAIASGTPTKKVLGYAWAEIPKAMIVVRVLICVGILTGLLRGSGTIAAFVYAGTSLIPKRLFLLTVFLICVALSYVLGSSFAVTGTAGVIFMAFARTGGVNPAIVAGAVLSGVYFGDRGAPTSSCLSLVSVITGTDTLQNSKRIQRISFPAYLVIIALYAGLSFANPLMQVDESILHAMESTFRITWVTAIPALIVVILPLFKLRIWKSMLLGALAALVIAVGYQHYTLLQSVGFMLWGFVTETELSSLNGGGIVSMKTAIILVPLASMLSGVLEGTKVLDKATAKASELAKRIGKLPAMLAVSVLSAMVFCNQTVCVMLSRQMLQSAYTDGSEMAMDISHTSSLIAAMVPWSIACSIPLALLGVGYSAMLFAFLVYLVPIYYTLFKKRLLKSR